MTDAPTLIWGAADWVRVVVPIAILMLLLLAWGYWRAGSSPRVRLLAAALKAIGIAILLLCLLEPLFSSTRPRPGENLVVVLADNSQSMNLRDKDAPKSRADEVKSITTQPSTWLGQLGKDFDVRQYAFDTQLHAEAGLDSLPFNGGASDLGESLENVVRRYQGRPLAGIILMTDGNATDPDAVDRVLGQATAATAGNAGAAKLPPVYPVLLGKEDSSNDINLERISVTQTNFEDAPVTVAAQIAASGFQGRTITVQLLDDAGRQIEQQKTRVDNDAEPVTVRFRLRPEQPGVSFYRVQVAAEPRAQQASTQPAGQQASIPATDDEATLANNSRLVTVDRGQGPYKVLYVSGRPNWEYKFLQRAIDGDNQVKLQGLIRVAKREPKFTFLGHPDERSNPLFRGFDNKDPDQVEDYDKPVLVRAGNFTAGEENDLRGGFPKTAEELYQYQAIILDDLESEFFTQDQMQLIKEFVRQRGGGLLMLGGQESFKNGKYDRTLIGDLLPVYVDEVPALPEGARMRLTLTREGWLEPWVRLRADEETERQRLNGMPAFATINSIRGIKPGATVLARADIEGGTTPVPALVEQRFGRGRSAALLLGDLWRWDMRRPANAPSDLEKAWRQTVRWLIADVPRRVEVVVAPSKKADDPEGTLSVGVRVRDPKYAPLDNASVVIHITAPDGKSLDLTAEANDREAGLYEATYVPRQPGAYRAEVKASAPDASAVGEAQAGWTSDPAADEFRVLKPNRALLDKIAKASGGETVNVADIDRFVASLPTKHAQITEPYIRPIWHQPWVFLLAILCLTAEWGVRRWHGLP